MQISTNPARGGAHNLEQEPVCLRVKGSKKKKGAYKRLKFSTDALAHAQQPVSGQSHDMPVPSQNPDLAPAELVTATFSVCQFEDCCEKAIYGFDTTGGFLYTASSSWNGCNICITEIDVAAAVLVLVNISVTFYFL